MSPQSKHLLVVALLVAFVGACDDDTPNESGDTSTTNTDTHDDTHADTTLPPCPSGPYIDGVCPPLLPSLQDWTCPEGWTQTPALVDVAGNPLSIEGVTQFARCEPPSFTEPPTECDPGTIPAYGQAVCARHGALCPAGDWPTEAELRARAPAFNGRVLYILAGAPPGGDGNPQTPFGTFLAAHGAAGYGDILAFSKGTFSENLHVTKTVALVGACVEGTTLSPANPDEYAATLVFENADAALVKDLTITGSRQGLGVVGSSEPVSVESVAVRAATGFGIFTLNGAQASLSEVWVTDTQPGPSNGDTGIALSIGGGSSISVTRSAFTKNRATAIDISQSVLALSNSLVCDTQHAALSFDGGVGIGISPESDVTIERSAFLRNRDTAIGAISASALSLRDVYVADTQPHYLNQGFGYGISLFDVPQATLERVVLVRNHTHGLRAEGSTFTAQNLYIADTQPRALNGKAGFGFSCTSGAHATIQNLTLLRNAAAGVAVWSDPLLQAPPQITIQDLFIANTRHAIESHGAAILSWFGPTSLAVTRAAILHTEGFGVFLEDTGAALDLSDALIFGSQSASASHSTGGFSGLGFAMITDTSAVLARVLIAQSQGTGLVVQGSRTSLEASDLTITDTASDAVGQAFGVGVHVGFGDRDPSLVTFSRVHISKSIAAGLSISDNTTFSASDLSINDTQPIQPDDLFGLGAQIYNGAHATFERLSLSRNHYTSLLVGTAETTVSVRGLLVQDAITKPCNGSSCPPLGVGVAVLEEAHLDLADFIITRCQAIGLIVSLDGSISARDGEISHNVIGLNIAVPGFDVAKAFLNVLLLDNDVDQDFSEIALPASFGTIQDIFSDPDTIGE